MRHYAEGAHDRYVTAANFEAAIRAKDAQLQELERFARSSTRDGEAKDAEIAYVLEALAGARDLLAAAGKHCGFLPALGGYSATMTEMEKTISDGVQSLDVILGGARPQRIDPKDAEIAHLTVRLRCAGEDRDRWRTEAHNWKAKAQSADAARLQAEQQIGTLEIQLADALRAKEQIGQERDRETEMRRESEAHNRALQLALEQHPYPDEYEDMKAARDAALQAQEALQAELREVHAYLTGKGEIGWCLTHPDGPTTELGKALHARLSRPVVSVEAIHDLIDEYLYHLRVAATDAAPR